MRILSKISLFLVRNMPRAQPIFSMLIRRELRKGLVIPNTDKMPYINSYITLEEDVEIGFHIAIARRVRNHWDFNVVGREIQATREPVQLHSPYENVNFAR
ncbi:hypothetical protein Tco_0437878 [Tanacetum coccineum]